MKIETSKGKFLGVNWMYGPTMTSGNVMIELEDSRLLSEIAADFEGCETIKKTDEKRGDTVYEIYEGYTVLRAISRNKTNGAVQVSLSKP